MNSYLIEGGHKLSGSISISGSKNATLPIIAASILNKGITVIENVPDIRDVRTMCLILQELGCIVKRYDDKLEIDAYDVTKSEIPEKLMREMRSSVILAGALIGRTRQCKFTYPGGCEIGSRPINLHLEAFGQLGVKVEEKNGYIDCKASKLEGTEIVLDFPSVGATENVMLASVFAEGETRIKNVAREPEIKNLQDFLNSMGAKIKGAGSNSIIIKGVEKLHDTEFSVIPDRIEAGSYLCMVAMTRGEVELKKVNPEHLSSALHKLKQMNFKISTSKNKIYMRPTKNIIATNIKTMPYPGFPTDMQSQFVTLLTLSKGTSIVVENIFENRYKYVNELIKMGANITLEDRTAIIQGVERLFSAKLEAKELRGGAALVTAALAASGTSEITGIEFIERGYENLVQKLTILGAKIIKQ
ncbi:MAG: UDP-N-acetylglucosamine 1-carboxyvinyltransferase [Clostridia bacterium]|nr:UDP-N-acetylglucosamine 1-carboxyvinyltransferase [Clostridia bacterium]